MTNGICGCFYSLKIDTILYDSYAIDVLRLCKVIIYLLIVNCMFHRVYFVSTMYLLHVYNVSIMCLLCVYYVSATCLLCVFFNVPLRDFSTNWSLKIPLGVILTVVFRQNIDRANLLNFFGGFAPLYIYINTYTPFKISRFMGWL